MRQLLNSLERLLLTAELESAFWAATIASSSGNADFLTELVDLQHDIKSGRFPYTAGTCSARPVVTAAQLNAQAFNLATGRTGEA